MRIVDYETGKTLKDVGISLSAQEADELIDYLNRLLDEPSLPVVHLSEVSGVSLRQEIAFNLDRNAAPKSKSVA